MNIKTAYGNFVPLSKKEEQQFKIIASQVSDKMSIRNPNRHKFVKELETLIEKYNKDESDEFFINMVLNNT